MKIWSNGGVLIREYLERMYTLAKTCFSPKAAEQLYRQLTNAEQIKLRRYVPPFIWNLHKGK